MRGRERGRAKRGGRREMKCEDRWREIGERGREERERRSGRETRRG
jgi:hypothetical protein